jgi:D-methionine transport system ATP-binding protein
MSEIIKIENLRKTYKSKKQELTAIKNINLSINEKDIYGIIGLSGAGKSTLIRCINLLEKPSEGKIIYQGQDLTTLKNKDLLKVRQQIGMIFQTFNLLEQRTVLENVLFPLEITKCNKIEAKEKALALLEEVGLSDKINSYPSQLSGGQKQRVAIARALANNPKVLLCDEATSALDPNTTNSILALLKEINQKYGITIIVITHEMKVIETICNKVAIIDNSLIVEEGDVKEIFINPKTQIAKDLILPKIEEINSTSKRIKLRLIFDGNVMDPVISTMILQTKVLVNIVKANVRTVDSKTYGEMILEISDDVTSLAKVKNFLSNNNVTFQEEVNYDN